MSGPSGSGRMEALEAAARWTGRVAGGLLAGVVLLLAVAEGLNPVQLDATEWVLFLFFAATTVGLVAGWRWERLGAVLALGGMAGFYLSHALMSGRAPHGPWFLVVAAPGLFYALAAFLKTRRA